MEQQEVKIISKEIVKPSIPLPSHPTIFTLSLFDQIFPVAHPVPALLFYPAIARGVGGDIDIISSLKHSLSQTLDRFYPLAGRINNESTISCNDQGVPFIEARVDCPISDVLTSPDKLKSLFKLLPSPKLIPLAVQISVFRCGGVVVGCYASHKIMDGTSFGTFLNHWASLASKRFADLVQPDFEAAIKAFPPLAKLDQIFTNPDITNFHPLHPVSGSNSPDPKIIVKSFVFNPDAIAELRAMATSDRVPKPTRFEALAGFIWEQNNAAVHAQVEQTELLFNIDMRKRMSPPLPRGSMGNLYVSHVQAQADKCGNLKDYAEVINSTLRNINKKITTVYQGENGAQVYLSERRAELSLMKAVNAEECQKGVYRLTSWCNMGLNEADFGFGRPVWVVPIDGRQPPLIFKNLIVLTDYTHPVAGVGIEAWLFLEENHMKALESNSLFLAFASPN